MLDRTVRNYLSGNAVSPVDVGMLRTLLPATRTVFDLPKLHLIAMSELTRLPKRQNYSRKCLNAFNDPKNSA